MSKDNIYSLARIVAGQRDNVFRNRERAAELIHVSTEALADYERGVTVPPCDVVAAMCEVYKLPSLRNRHMKACCPLMREGVAECSELTRAALSWVTALKSAKGIGRDFAALALDGTIAADEVTNALAVRQKAVELTRVMQETITAIDTALAGGKP